MSRFEVNQMNAHRSPLLCNSISERDSPRIETLWRRSSPRLRRESHDEIFAVSSTGGMVRHRHPIHAFMKNEQYGADHIPSWELFRILGNGQAWRGDHTHSERTICALSATVASLLAGGSRSPDWPTMTAAQDKAL
jgi:hypothetical protein